MNLAVSVVLIEKSMVGLAAESDSEPRMIASQPENYLFMSFRTVLLRISNRLRTAGKWHTRGRRTGCRL